MPLFGRYLSSGMDTTWHYIWRYVTDTPPPTPSDAINFIFRFRYWFR